MIGDHALEPPPPELGFCEHSEGPRIVKGLSNDQTYHFAVVVEEFREARGEVLGTCMGWKRRRGGPTLHY